MKSDKLLIIVLTLLLIFGLAALYSASSQKIIAGGKNFVINQIIWIILGAGVAFLITRVNYHSFLSVAYIIYAIQIIFLILVLFLGKTVLGAQRWINFGGIGFQPSEFSKIFTVLILARIVGDEPQRFQTVKGLIAPFLIVIIPMSLIFLQPDLGTALIFIPIFLTMLWVGGIKIKYLGAAISSIALCLPLFWQMLRDYQKDRLLVFLNPNLDPLGAGYTINQSKIAIGSGMFTGKGWLAGTQTQLNFIPERHTDFIFSVIGEETGFIGASIILILFLILILKALKVAETTKNISGRLIVAGMATILALHVIINIGMTLGLMPVVGMPLPFLSYGGSALITNFMAVGFILNVRKYRAMF
ncbi:MAG: rod shape-determining protein RodA [Candidatus Omnitrophica bacterium]|nr:rod shape-determining protein RodA [Candidatus Omnitrophota bacterium]MBU1925813.1 rod shape-determining protein RodA [Candidatus Omnitrophota bacterium]